MGMYCQLRAIRMDDVEQLAADPESMAEPHLSEPGSSLSLEKAWHGLHFLLTGSAGEGMLPLGFLLQGGEAVGEDLGYGPARVLGPDEVRRVHTALSGVSDDQLWSRFDPARMEAEGIYPVIWDEPEADLREEYLGYFHELKQLLQSASADGKALMIVVT